jgi:hypothetical protein
MCRRFVSMYVRCRTESMKIRPLPGRARSDQGHALRRCRTPLRSGASSLLRVQWWSSCRGMICTSVAVWAAWAGWICNEEAPDAKAPGVFFIDMQLR